MEILFHISNGIRSVPNSEQQTNSTFLDSQILMACIECNHRLKVCEILGVAVHTSLTANALPDIYANKLNSPVSSHI